MRYITKEYVIILNDSQKCKYDFCYQRRESLNFTIAGKGSYANVSKSEKHKNKRGVHLPRPLATFRNDWYLLKYGCF